MFVKTLNYRTTIIAILSFIAGQLLMATVEIHGDLKAINLAIYYAASECKK